jgi:hypothetical protein
LQFYIFGGKENGESLCHADRDISQLVKISVVEPEPKPKQRGEEPKLNCLPEPEPKLRIAVWLWRRLLSIYQGLEEILKKKIMVAQEVFVKLLKF